jgi:hypothetical protein
MVRRVNTGEDLRVAKQSLMRKVRCLDIMKERNRDCENHHSSYTQDVGLAITWLIHCARNAGENGGDVEDL